MSKKPPSRTATVYFTKYGEWYVKAGELLQSTAAREEIRKMAELALARRSGDKSKDVTEDQKSTSFLGPLP